MVILTRGGAGYYPITTTPRSNRLCDNLCITYVEPDLENPTPLNTQHGGIRTSTGTHVPAA